MIYEFAMFNAIQSGSLENVKEVRKKYNPDVIDTRSETILAVYFNLIDIYNYINPNNDDYVCTNNFRLYHGDLTKPFIDTIGNRDLYSFHPIPVNVLDRLIDLRHDLCSDILLLYIFHNSERYKNFENNPDIYVNKNMFYYALYHNNNNDVKKFLISHLNKYQQYTFYGDKCKGKTTYFDRFINSDKFVISRDFPAQMKDYEYINILADWLQLDDSTKQEWLDVDFYNSIQMEYFIDYITELIEEIETN